MSILTAKDYNSLSREEQILAEALGLKVDSKSTRKGKGRCKSGSSYILVTHIRCRLCDNIWTRVFKMEKVGSYLLSKEIAEIPSKEELGGKVIKSSSYTVRQCRGCQSYLSTFTKEELVSKFLSYIKEPANFIS